MDPTVWLEKNVPSFVLLPEPERAAIKDFAVLWTIYEGQVLDTSGNAETIIGAAKKLKSQGRLSLDPLWLAIEYFTRRYFDGVELTSAFHDLDFRRNDRQDLVENVLRGNTKDDADILSAILIIIYRLRNNFFHGKKWSYGMIDHFDNFHNANEILMAVVDMQLRPRSSGISIKIS